MNYDVFIDLSDTRETETPEPKVNLGIKIYDVFIDLSDTRETEIPEPKVNLGIKIDEVIYHYSWSEFREMVTASIDKLSGITDSAL